MKSQDLRDNFKEVAAKFFKSKEVRQRIVFLADNYNSFEGWLNWELAYALARKYPWPHFTAHRECRYPYPAGGLADIAFYKGIDYNGTQAVSHVETKLIWNNGNAGKMIGSLARDEARLQEQPGSNVLVVVAISSGTENFSGLRDGSAEVFLKRIEKGLRPATRRSPNLLFAVDIPSRLGGYYVHPSIRVATYDVH